MVVQAMGGVMSITGQDGGPPTRVGTSIGDIAAGLFAAVGITSALVDRQQSGTGRKVDVAMLDAQVAILENAIARFAATGESPRPIGNRHPSIAPFGAFEASDGLVVVAAGNDRLFRRLCDAVGAPELAGDPRFGTNADRCRHVGELTAALERRTRAGTVAGWLDVLGAAEIPCGPVNGVREVLEDPQVRARNMVVDVLDDRLEGLRVAGNPVKISGFEDPPHRGPVPRLGGPAPT
jgi:CoA:oxalate CoA-transferase